MKDFPRPLNNTGIGFHYFPDPGHTGRDDADRWIPRLKALGASWLVLRTTVNRPIPDPFLQRLMLVDIEPVVMILPSSRAADPGPIGPLDPTMLRETVRALADSGVHYVVLYDRPNERSNWSGEQWAKPALVERFVDHLAPALEVVSAEGLYPVLPPLEPFGAYWDTTFLQAMLNSLRRRGLGSVLERAAVGIRNFANERSLDWGLGGRQAWPRARPYAEQTDGEDHRGFRLFEWYQEIIEHELGAPLPMICCANGPQKSNQAARPFDAASHANLVTEMARMMLDGEMPGTVFNHAFWLLAADRHHPAYSESWFDTQGMPRLPAVEALRKLVPVSNSPAPAAVSEGRQTAAKVRAARSGPAPAAVRPHRPAAARSGGAGARNGRKPIAHYLLLPVFEWGVSQWYLGVVQEYVAAFRPTCGFSLEEAKLARRVTIVGNTQGVSGDAEQALKEAGCQVERIAGQTGQETRQLLEKLARNEQLPQ